LSRARAVLIGLLLAASVTQSLFFAWALVPDPEEEMYLYLGKLALTGRISLFQDEIVGNRMPLPYYVAGLSQVVFPRSFVAGRLFSATLGLVCLLLIWRVTSRVAGELAGLVALLFASTQSLLIGYFDVVSYHALVSFLLLVALYLELCVGWPYRRVAAMACVSLLFFTRATMMPLIPAALVYFLWRERGARARTLTVLVTALPPVLFFASDVRHWKFLAYVPVFDRVASALGFVSNRGEGFAIGNIVASENPVWSAALLFARGYRMWIVAVLGVLAVSVVAWMRGRSIRPLFASSGVNLVAGTVLYLGVWQFVIMGPWKLQLAVGYFPQFAILAAICLGYWAAIVLDRLIARPRERSLALLALAGFFAVAPAESRPPMLPLAVSWQDPAVTALGGLASQLREVIPPGARVFHLGGPLGLYLAGVEPYLRQERDVAALALPGIEAGAERSGLWGRSDITRWLGREADYAVIVWPRAGLYRGTPLQPDLDLIDSLLRSHFARVAVLTRYPGSTYEVYRRVR